MTELEFTEEINEEVYIPSSSEKKQAILMYMFVGLLLSMGKNEVSPYTYHHIKQSMLWLVLFILSVFLVIILLIFWAVFWMFFSIIGLLIIIPVFALWIVCMKQAWDGEYLRNSEGALKFFGIFSWLGVWILNLFDSNHYQVMGNTANDSGVNYWNFPQGIQMNQQQNIQENNPIQNQVQQGNNDPLTQMGINSTIGKPMA